MTDQTPSMCFSGNPLDRAGNFRGDPAWLAEKYQSDDALFIPLWQLQPLLLPPIAAGYSRDVVVEDLKIAKQPALLKAHGYQRTVSVEE